MKNVAELVRSGWVSKGVFQRDGEVLVLLYHPVSQIWAYCGNPYEKDATKQLIRYVICEHCKERGKTLATLIHADAAACQEATMQRSLERL